MRVIRSWMNQPFKWFGSIAMTHLLTLTYCHLLAVLISHLKYLHFFKIISNISFQRFMFQISKHYLCICNCRLAFCVLPSCIKQCVNTSKCLFICIAKIHFVDTDFICLVTAQMQEFDSKKWLKGKNVHKTCWKKNYITAVNWPHRIWRISKKFRSQLSMVIF